MRPNLLSFLGGVAFAAGAFVLAGMQSGGPGTAISPDAREFLSHVTMLDMPNGRGGTVRMVRLSGLNLQIVNGLGASNELNGTGNIIIGYAETLGTTPLRVGSHNLVNGSATSYVSTGGIAWGSHNTSGGRAAIALGGQTNTAGGDEAIVIGGSSNKAGFQEYPDYGNYPGRLSVIVGGSQNRTVGWEAVVSGGFANAALGDNSTVSGGASCEARGIQSSVSGGSGRTASGPDDWVAGSLFEDN